MYSMSTSPLLNPGIGTDTQYWYRCLVSAGDNVLNVIVVL